MKRIPIRWIVYRDKIRKSERFIIGKQVCIGALILFTTSLLAGFYNLTIAGVGVSIYGLYLIFGAD